MKDFAAQDQKKLIEKTHAHIEHELQRSPVLFAVTNFRRLKQGNVKMAIKSLAGFSKAAALRFLG